MKTTSEKYEPHHHSLIIQPLDQTISNPSLKKVDYKIYFHHPALFHTVYNKYGVVFDKEIKSDAAYQMTYSETLLMQKTLDDGSMTCEHYPNDMDNFNTSYSSYNIEYVKLNY